MGVGHGGWGAATVGAQGRKTGSKCTSGSQDLTAHGHGNAAGEVVSIPKLAHTLGIQKPSGSPGLKTLDV